MKVLLLNNGEEFSGVESLENELVKYINDNIKVDILVPNLFVKKRINYDNVYSLNVSRKSLLGRIKYDLKYIKYLKRNKYDIVHINGGAFFYSFRTVLISKLFGVNKVIVHIHSIIINKGIKNFIKRVLNPLYYKMVDKIIVCSDTAKYSVLTKDKDKDNKIVLLKNGIDIDKFKYKLSIRKKLRDKYELNDKVVFGHTGRFSSLKNHEYLIDLFNEIHKQLDNAYLILVGEGELLRNIKAKVHSLKLDKYVLFLGYQDNINELLNCMDVFIFPSISEGLGISCIESQTNGLLTYCSNNIPVEANITPCFRYFDLNDNIKSVAKEIINDKYNSHSKDAYKDVIEAGYDIKDIAKQLIDIYLNV